MTTTSLKRGAAPPRQKPAPKAASRPATVALPVSQRALRRNVAITIGVLGIAAAVIVAGLMGVWRRAGDEIVRQTAVAGLEVRHVEVTGTRELALLPVYQAALPGRDNAMLTSDLGAIRARLLALPWVADASVSRRLPDTLAIKITERRPVALWQHHQRLQAIDITGVPLTHDRLERFANLPLVVGSGANTRVREFLVLAATAPTLAPKVDAAFEAARHDFHRSDERGGFPIAFSAETKARRHHALRTDAGQLREAVQIFKRVGVACKTAVGEKCFESQFNARRVADGLVTQN